VALFCKLPFLGWFGSRNDGLSINTLVEPISHQQSDFCFRCHLEWQKSKLRRWHCLRGLQRRQVPLASPQQHLRSQWDCSRHGWWGLPVPFCLIAKIEHKNWTLPFLYSFRCLDKSLSQMIAAHYNDDFTVRSIKIGSALNRLTQ
jgi:hypothetical protein